MSNHAEVEASTGPKSSTIVIAILIPSVLILVFLTLIVIIKSQHFYDWLATQKEQNPEWLHTKDPVCAICLDDLADDAQIRGLRCSHAFHAHCLDEWFTRYNEYCPLCHRPIIPGSRLAQRRRRERPDPIPVMLMV
ncbi:hypothetical protein BKA66DRAFT_410645 [Pyrenochaeta sp. MPI-SDFR-AT-0127]|nr:hypothetical protein BKA66DRAFT_410645 [Pyrenochaeta sp. MPI-SDFR-AT-0127]